MGGDAPPRNATMADAAGVTLAGRIMVGTVIALFFVVVIIMCIHIYMRVFLWRRSSSVRRGFMFASADGVAGSEGLRGGVDITVLRSLPVVMFSRLEHKDGLECAVCLSAVEEGEKARILPNCSHGFHVGCIDMWLQSHSTCPLCRSPVSPQASEQLVNRENGLPLPTNVLFWGNEVQVSSRMVSSDAGRQEETLVIVIPRNNLCNNFASSDTRLTDQDELRSPLSSRVRSLTRLWSMDNRVAPSSSSTDVEQGDPRI
ncbi:unnamed protein product [Rhodiola kirilowii]